jgi:hypothetical protein
MAHDDQFTAVGPPLSGSGFPRSGFSTRATGMVYGLNVQGDRCGVYGESGGLDSDRESDVEGVGVCGEGRGFGIFGKAPNGLAGVYGQHNDGRMGVIGAVMRGGTAVLGANLASLGNPLATFQTVPPTGDGGSGTGVMGISGSGSGVHGASERGTGVFGASRFGFGVHGSSDDGPGGVFESGNAAQVRLIPSAMASPEGRVRGEGGELLATMGTSSSGQSVFRLWFCTRAGDAASAGWDLVAGSRPFPGAPVSEGATGIDVERIQMRLNMVLGTDLNGDGELGPITREAVRAFQEREQLPQDGVVNAETWDRLFALQ